MLESPHEAFTRWGQSYRDGNHLFYPSNNALDGNLALLETSRYRNNGRISAQGVETRVRRTATGADSDPVASSVESFMVTIKKRRPYLYGVLMDYYLIGKSVRQIARELKVEVDAITQVRDEGLQLYEAGEWEQ